ncbi:response regulator [Paenibacillus sp. GD4]|uniref:response regulator transcription factor n=1 Tax=Paenibacillus sp. GD4 TaxID=3068890 RepID=UPI00279664B0|nr:response regulator [Paenibacillus sp. GD4]MDQ1913902.1 response regulator [Paenibacillus sp. GD4]
MWTVLLVEDEAFVRRMIRSSMPWESKGFQVIGEADHGEEALEFIRKYRPDLVVTDIMMPRMNGVELLKQARREGHTCRFVMLSVMDDFQYVQQALEFGASNYILKLYLSPEKISEVLDKVDEELRKQTVSWSREMEEVYENLWSRLLNSWKDEQSLPSGPAMAPGLPSSRCLIIHLIHGKPSFTLDAFLALGIVGAEAAPHLNLFHKQGQTTVFYWLPPSAPAAAFKANTPAWKEGVAVYASVYPSVDLPNVWEHVIRRADEQWYAGKTGVFGVGIPSDHPIAAVPTWELEREVIRCLEQKQADSCKAQVSRLWELFRGARQPSALVLEAADRLVKLFALITGRTPSISNEAPLAISHDGLQTVVELEIDKSIRSWHEQSVEVTDHPEINKVIQYIRSNYASEITVTGLAELAAMDDKYLCGVFKKKTGETIVGFIQRVRIEQARAYLEHTDWPIAEISYKAGFAHENYFAKVFRKLTGMTPSAYRQQVQHKS